MRRPEFELGYNAIMAILEDFTDEEREEIFNRLKFVFCPHCGCKQPIGRRCQCWNDD